jgi:hypothetical protein
MFPRFRFSVYSTVVFHRSSNIFHLASKMSGETSLDHNWDFDYCNGIWVRSRLNADLNAAATSLRRSRVVRYSLRDAAVTEISADTRAHLDGTRFPPVASDKHTGEIT